MLGGSVVYPPAAPNLSTNMDSSGNVRPPFDKIKTYDSYSVNTI